MSEVQTRPSASRGRGSGRTGRGGHSSRASARPSNRQANGSATTEAATAIPLDEQGELGQLKMQYASQLETLKELFPEWTDNDLVLAVQESDGDLQSTIEAITEGKVYRFEDVTHKPKEKSRSKTKETPAVAVEQSTASTRGRSRGSLESTRGGRGRGERGRARARSARGAPSAVNGAPSAGVVASIPTTESTSWDTVAPDAGTTGSWEQPGTVADGVSGGQWGSVVASDATPATASEGQKSSLIPEGTKKSWASMLAQPKAAPKPAPAAPPPIESLPQREMPVIQEPTSQPAIDLETFAHPPAVDSYSSDPQMHGGTSANLESFGMPSEGAIDLEPPKDMLTEDNLENLPDTSIPPATDTTASTRDPRSAAGSVDPYAVQQFPPTSRPPVGGYATTAWKAAGMPGRSASYQRRILEQREAVVMPGNHAVDRAAVQFGQMGLNSENRPIDVDEDREDAETRAQPPQQSPTAQPRASLPPAPQPAMPAMPSEPMTIPENLPTPRQAPGLPPVSHPPQHSSLPQHNAYAAPYSSQYGRYGAGSMGQQEPLGSIQRSYDPFSQQLSYPHSQQDGPPGQSQIPGSMPQQSHTGGYSQTAADYGSQYGTEHQRSAYQNYYGSSYGQQGTSSQQDQNMPPQRSTSGFGGEAVGGANQSAQGAGRFGESSTSGHTTPSQAAAVSQQQQPHTQGMQHPQSHTQSGHGGGYPYGQPFYGGSYYNSYVSQFPGYNYNQQGYGNVYGNKGGMYGQPHHGYGISPQTGYEHSASPGNAGSGFGSSSLGRDSGFSGGLSDYNRSGSAQPHHSSAGFPASMGSNDAFGRGASGYSNQGSQYGSGQPQGSAAGADESLKAFPDTSKAGASPSALGGLPGRTGSANQSSFQPQQGGFGGYPSHLSQQLHGTSPYGGLGGLGHQGGASGAQSQQGGYGGYGGAGGFGNYGNYGRGGWGGNYGH